jgi:hypothetical protein
MSNRQVRGRKLLIVLGVLVTDATFGFALHELGLSLLWLLLILTLLTALAGGGNWLMLRSLRRSLARVSAGQRQQDSEG